MRENVIIQVIPINLCPGVQGQVHWQVLAHISKSDKLAIDTCSQVCSLYGKQCWCKLLSGLT